jgi:hypothetical protein
MSSFIFHIQFTPLPNDIASNLSSTLMVNFNDVCEVNVPEMIYHMQFPKAL